MMGSFCSRRLVLTIRILVGEETGLLIERGFQCHTIAVLVCFVGQTYNGGGNHWYDIEVPWEFERLKQWQYAQVAIAVFGVSVVKVSIGLGMLRFLTGKWTRRFAIFLIGKRATMFSIASSIADHCAAFVIVATIVCLSPFLFECQPMSISWAYERPLGKCIPFVVFKAFADANAGMYRHNIVRTRTYSHLEQRSILQPISYSFFCPFRPFGNCKSILGPSSRSLLFLASAYCKTRRKTKNLRSPSNFGQCLHYRHRSNAHRAQAIPSE